jgi:hypothetical protein
VPAERALDIRVLDNGYLRCRLTSKQFAIHAHGVGHLQRWLRISTPSVQKFLQLIKPVKDQLLLRLQLLYIVLQGGRVFTLLLLLLLLR